MIYVVLLHLIAGTFVGSLFAVGMLAVLLSVEIMIAIILTFAYGPAACLGCVAAVMALQIGYFSGVIARGLLEQAGNLAGARPPGEYLVGSAPSENQSRI